MYIPLFITHFQANSIFAVIKPNQVLNHYYYTRNTFQLSISLIKWYKNVMLKETISSKKIKISLDYK